MSKVIYTGLESSGKSLRLAMKMNEIGLRNAKWRKKSGIARAIAPNFKLTPMFEDVIRNEYGLEIIYWEDIDDLIKLKECDVFIDEVGNYFDARNWSDLSRDAKKWITQGAKMGLEIYGAAQDFAQVDIAFRRLVNELYMITKLFGSARPSNTKPPIKRIWGLCFSRALDPRGYKEDEKKFEPISAFAWSFFLIERQYTQLFDTNAEIKNTRPSKKRHIVYTCMNADCDWEHVKHE